MALLFEPLKLGSLVARNRLMVSPMCEYSSEDGFANDWHLVHLGSRAVGGAGIVMTEATAVSPEGRISPHDLGIYKDEHIEKLQQITQFIHEHGAIAGVQLAHAGRKASHARPWDGGKQIASGQGGWITVAPSAIPFQENTESPVELDKKGLQKIVNDFEFGAKRALDAGFKIIELHAAHGYLLHEFLSPFSNQRKDEYGGSFENRIRILTEVTDAVRKVWPQQYPLFIRISATDWADGGWNIDESVELVHRLKQHGVDLIDCSSGGLLPHVQIPLGPGYQVPFAERIKKETGILTGTVGLITEAKQAENILQQQQADLIVMAREFLRDPYFPLHAAQQLQADIEWPPQYLRAKPH